MKKNKLSIYFIFVAILTVITIFFLMVQKSYFNLIKPQQSAANNALLKDISPNLDTSVLDLIESKDKNIEDNFDYSIVKSPDQKNISTTPTPSPVIIPSNTPTP